MRQTASAVQRCIIKRNYSSLPLINWVSLTLAGGMARHGERSWPCRWSGCCSRCRPVCVSPPQDPHASQYRQWVGAGRLVLPCCGETVRWASWYRKTQIPQGTRYCWKTPDPPPCQPPAEIQAKGAGWGQALGTPLARGFLRCILWCLGLAQGRERCVGYPTKSSLCSREPPGSAQRLGDAHLSCTQGWVWGRSQRDGSSKGGPRTPNPRSEVPAVAAARQAQRRGCALARTQRPGPPGRETNFRSAPEGLFWTLCSA